MPVRSKEIINLPAGDPLHVFILESFARTGRSPTLAQIRERFQLSSLAEAEQMVSALERSGAIHRNPGDPLITHAYPFSNEPTAHRVRLADGPEVYSMCAIDALGMPFMLHRDADIASRCEGCGADVRVSVRGSEIASYEPAGIAVWLAERGEGCLAATDLCPDLNFFCSMEHVTRWASDHPQKQGQRLTLEEGLTRGRQVFERLLDA